MARPAFIEVDGKRHLWRDLIELRKSQVRQAAAPAQPLLFELREDHKPACEMSAVLRYREPSLLDLMKPG